MALVCWFPICSSIDAPYATWLVIVSKTWKVSLLALSRTSRYMSAVVRYMLFVLGANYPEGSVTFST